MKKNNYDEIDKLLLYILLSTNIRCIVKSKIENIRSSSKNTSISTKQNQLYKRMMKMCKLFDNIDEKSLFQLKIKSKIENEMKNVKDILCKINPEIFTKEKEQKQMFSIAKFFHFLDLFGINFVVIVKDSLSLTNDDFYISESFEGLPENIETPYILRQNQRVKRKKDLIENNEMDIVVLFPKKEYVMSIIERIEEFRVKATQGSKVRTSKLSSYNLYGEELKIENFAFVKDSVFFSDDENNNYLIGITFDNNKMIFDTQNLKHLCPFSWIEKGDISFSIEIGKNKKMKIDNLHEMNDPNKNIYNINESLKNHKHSKFILVNEKYIRK